MSAPPPPPRFCARPFARGAALLVLVALQICLAPVTTSAQEEAGDDLLVLAAASLVDVLPRVAEAWHEQGGMPVRFSFSATSRLAPQAVQSSADVFFSADEEWMEWLQSRGAVDADDVRSFLGNRLVLITPASAAEPVSLSGLAGVAELALAGDNVPAGRYAREALMHAQAWEAVSTRVVRAGSVRGVLAWVARGEAAAGIVYETDALAEPAVRTVHVFPPGAHRPVRYPAAVLVNARHPEEARAFLDFVSGAQARDLFTARGFSTDDARGPAQAAERGTGPSVGSAIRISLLVAFLATVVGLLPALAIGWLLARHDFPGKILLSTVVLAPLVIPPVVTGFLLLSLLGTRGLLGGALTALGITVPFSVLGAAVAALTVGLPLYVIAVRGAFEAVDEQYEELSWTLGVPPRRTFLRVSLPLALPGIAAGSLLAFARALGEFGATIVLAGNVEGSTRTIALAVYTLLESPQGQSATWLLVGASVAISLAALFGYEALSRRQRRMLEDRRGR